MTFLYLMLLLKHTSMWIDIGWFSSSIIDNWQTKADCEGMTSATRLHIMEINLKIMRLYLHRRLCIFYYLNLIWSDVLECRMYRISLNLDQTFMSAFSKAISSTIDSRMFSYRFIRLFGSESCDKQWLFNPKIEYIYLHAVIHVSA